MSMHASCPVQLWSEATAASRFGLGPAIVLKKQMFTYRTPATARNKLAVARLRATK